MKTPLTIKKFGKFLAIFSLAIGTIMLLIYFYAMSLEVAFYCYGLLIIIVAINLLTLLYLIIILFYNKEKISGSIKIIGLLLLNIPIAFIYLYIFDSLTQIIRLTITNSSNSEITNLTINGCEEKHLESLNINESTTVWIKIPGDCSVHASYQINCIKKNEEVIGYVSNSEGQKKHYTIGEIKNH